MRRRVAERVADQGPRQMVVWMSQIFAASRDDIGPILVPFRRSAPLTSSSGSLSYEWVLVITMDISLNRDNIASNTLQLSSSRWSPRQCFSHVLIVC